MGKLLRILTLAMGLGVVATVSAAEEIPVSWSTATLGELDFVVKNVWLGMGGVPTVLTELELTPEQSKGIEDVLKDYHRERQKLTLVPDPREPNRVLRAQTWNKVDQLLTVEQKRRFRKNVILLHNRYAAFLLTTEPLLAQELKLTDEQFAQFQKLYQVTNKSLMEIDKDSPDRGKKYGTIPTNPQAAKDLEAKRNAYRQKKVAAIDVSNAKAATLLNEQQKIIWKSLLD
jgi:Spy/CpxP family protein refolding chaperone